MGSIALMALSGWALWLTLNAIFLQKGEICPGQRGRLHKALLPLFAVSVVLVFVSPFVLISLIPLAVFVFQTKTGKTKETGPIALLWLSVAGGWIATIIVFLSAPWISGLYCLLVGLIWGMITTHLMLLYARSRLQAFHRLLPFFGIAALMLTLVVFVFFLSQFSPLALSALLIVILCIIVLQVIAVFLWSKHLFKHQIPTLSWIWSAWGIWTITILLSMFLPLMS
jgi:hypothetical protein